MKGIIFDIKHFAIHDGPGIRQTVFLKGCPLSCWWCHNPESQNNGIEFYTKTNKLDGMEFKKEATVGYEISSEALFKTILGDKVFFEESDGGVTFSGGEPLVQFEFLKETMQKCRDKNIHTALDTTGFVSKTKMEEIASLTDVFLYDVKLLNNEQHIKYTGVSNKQILENLRWLDDNNYNVTLRFPVIPGITDTEENINGLKTLMTELKHTRNIDLLPYHNISNSKYIRFRKENRMGKTTALENKDLKNLQRELAQTGFNVQIGG